LSQVVGDAVVLNVRISIYEGKNDGDKLLSTLPTSLSASNGALLEEEKDIHNTMNKFRGNF
jgi:hypothetical protein